jgi:hypothetical protein
MRVRLEKFSQTNAARESAQIVQHRRAQFAGELVHDVHGFFHQPLRAGDVAVEALGVDRGLLGQGRQPDVDAGQGLGDDIVEFAADFPALLLLRRRIWRDNCRNCFLQAIRLFQQLP